MKKILAKLFIVLIATVTLVCNSAFALIRSEGDINQAVYKLNQIQNQDFVSFINKSELVGNRLGEFKMVSEQYKTSAAAASDTLKGILSQIETVTRSSDIASSDKEMQIRTLYSEANTVLLDMDNKTITYISSLGSIMPSITYERFIKKYTTYYNNL